MENIDLDAFKNILDTLPIPVTLNKKCVDKNGDSYDCVEYVNKTFLERVGYSTSEIPTDLIWFETAYPDLAYQRLVHNQWFDAWPPT